MLAAHLWLQAAFAQTSPHTPTPSLTPAPTPVPIAKNNPDVPATKPKTSASYLTETPAEMTVLADLVHFGDLIDVDIVGSVEYDWRGRVDEDGFLSGMQFVDPPVYALCRSEQHIARSIALLYGKFLRDPQVTVKILDRSNRPLAVVLGAVSSPSRFQLKRPVRLNELIILSGGVGERAGGDIQIYRPKNSSCGSQLEISGSKTGDQTSAANTRERFVSVNESEGSRYLNIRIADLIAGKPEANPVILTGDVVTVFEAQPVFITGAVNNPRKIFVRQEMTLSRAIDSAGGLLKSLKSAKAIIYRRNGGATQLLEADLDKIKSGQAPDIALKPYDVIDVTQPGAPPRKFAPVALEDDRPAAPVHLPLRVIE